MKTKNILLPLLFLWILLILGACGATKNTTKTVDQQESKKHHVFPKDWKGVWKGRLYIYKATGLVSEIDMQLRILPTAIDTVWTWNIIYGEITDDNRPYELIPIQSQQGHYIIDEKNGILLDVYFQNETLYSRFEVADNDIFITYTLLEDELIFRVVSGSKKPIRSTGGDASKEIPLVLAYPISTTQEARLKLEK